MNKYKKLYNNTYLFALGTFGSKSITFLMLPVFTRLLSASEYGNLSIILTTVTLLVPLISMKLAEAIFRFSMDKSADKVKTFTSALAFTLMMFLLFFLFYPFLNLFEVFRGYIAYLYILVFMSIQVEQVKELLRGLGKLKLFALSDILETVLFAIFSLYFLIQLDLSLDGYLLALVLSKFLAFIFILYKAKLYKYLSIKRFDIKYIKTLLIYSAPLIPNVAMWWVVNSSDKYLIAHYLGLEATGIYSVSYMFPTIITLAYSVFFSAWQIAAVEEYSSKDKDNFFSHIFSLSCTVSLVGLGAFLVILKPLMSVYVADEFYSAWSYMPFLLIGATFKTFASFYGVGYFASKKTMGAFNTSVIAAVLNIGLNVWLIPLWGIQGASFSTMVAFLVFWLVRIKDTQNYFNINLSKAKLIMSLIIIGMQSAILYLNLTTILLIVLEIALFSLLLLVNIKMIGQVINHLRQEGLPFL